MRARAFSGWKWWGDGDSLGADKAGFFVFSGLLRLDIYRTWMFIAVVHCCATLWWNYQRWSNSFGTMVVSTAISFAIWSSSESPSATWQGENSTVYFVQQARKPARAPFVETLVSCEELRNWFSPGQLGNILTVIVSFLDTKWKHLHILHPCAKAFRMGWRAGNQNIVTTVDACWCMLMLTQETRTHRSNQGTGIAAFK